MDEDWQWLVGQAAMDAATARNAGMSAATTEQATVKTAAQAAAKAKETARKKLQKYIGRRRTSTFETFKTSRLQDFKNF